MKPASAFALTLVAAACSSPAVHVLKAPPPTMASGWTFADDQLDGIQIGVPNGWHEGADSSKSGLEMATEAGSSAPQPLADSGPGEDLQGQITSASEDEQKEAFAKLRSEGIVIQAIDSSRPIPGEERTKFFVKKNDHGGNISLETAKSEEKSYYEGENAPPPETVNLPIGPVYKFSCDYKTRGGDDLRKISFVVVDGKESYSLRFVSTNNPEAINSIADQVAATWRINPSN